MGFSFTAPARTKSGDLEAFLKSIEPEAKEMGFKPTLVLNARFDTPERREFARRLVTYGPNGQTREGVEATINNMTQKGWRLISVSPNANKPEILLVLKRHK